MRVLVGSTGFVGSNLWRSGAFDAGYHSTDVREAYGTRPELLVYAGVRAEKFLANQQPEADEAHVRQAFENICQIAPRRVALVSTIDVYPTPAGVDELSRIDDADLAPYGRDRLLLERLVRERYPDATVLRLPGLYGAGIKKNFLFDLIRLVPQMLKAAKLEELAARDPTLPDAYERLDNGFYRLRADVTPAGLTALRRRFEALGFTALAFTDSRSRYQFYPLSRLWDDLRRALTLSLPLVNLATEPLDTATIHHAVTGHDFTNELAAPPARYEFRTRYAAELGGANGYLMGRDALLADIVAFVRAQRQALEADE